MNRIALITDKRVCRVAALVAIALTSVLATSVFAANGAAPAKYRFTGWMAPSPLRGEWPSHLLVEATVGRSASRTD